MITVYCADENGFYNGSKQQDSKKPFSRSCTLEPPPEGKTVKLYQGKWVEAVKQKNNAPTYDYSKIETELRLQRNNLLIESDWTQLPDTNLSEEKKQEWAAYRQLLRDIFTENQNLLLIVMPDKPK